MSRIFVLLILTFGSGAALAEDFNYSFVGAGYSRADVDGETGDGFGIGGSAAVSDNWHVFGGYQALGFDFDIDLSSFNLGLGFNTPITESIDVVAQASFVSAKVDSTFVTIDDTGYALGVGFRAWLSDRVELDGSVTYSDLGVGSNDTSFGGGVQFYLTEQISIGLALGFSSDADTYSLGGRFYF